MRLDDILFSQGFGTRRYCDGLVLNGRVAIAGRVIDDPDEPVNILFILIEAEADPQHVAAHVGDDVVRGKLLAERRSLRPAIGEKARPHAFGNRIEKCQTGHRRFCHKLLLQRRDMRRNGSGCQAFRRQHPLHRVEAIEA